MCLASPSFQFNVLTACARHQLSYRTAGKLSTATQALTGRVPYVGAHDEGFDPSPIDFLSSNFSFPPPLPISSEH